MVHSYRGARKEPEKPRREVSKVKDCMATKLITFRPEQRMVEVIKTLVEKGISGGPVVDEENNLIGVISEGDCLREVVKGRYADALDLSGKVAEYMVTEVITIDPETDVLQAAQMFLKQRLRRFPVMQQGKLLGQVSQRDIMKAVLQNRI